MHDVTNTSATVDGSAWLWHSGRSLFRLEHHIIGARKRHVALSGEQYWDWKIQPLPGLRRGEVKVAGGHQGTHKPLGELHWVICLRENLTSSSFGEGLETGEDESQYRPSRWCLN
jgi:hypothetical protein